MFAARSWLMAFLSFSITLQKTQADFIAPTTVMALAGISGMLASILGGELASRLGRRRVVAVIMGGFSLMALIIGFSARMFYNVVVTLYMIYTLFFQGDSAAIHTGVIASVETERRRAAMAL